MSFKISQRDSCLWLPGLEVYHHNFIRDLAIPSNALIATVGNASKVTGPKQTQLITFRNHFQSYGCSLEEAGIMPRSFILEDQKECRNFFSYSRKRQQSSWILKPVSGEGGAIHSNLTFFNQHVLKSEGLLYRNMLSTCFYSTIESSTFEPTCSKQRHLHILS